MVEDYYEETSESAGRRVAECRAKAEQDAAKLPELAKALVSYAWRLTDEEEYEAGVQAVSEAVQLYGRLVAGGEMALLPELAGLLNNRGMMLSELGKLNEAYESTEEAVKLHRQLVAQGPGGYEPALASSLNNLGTLLASMGKNEEALRIADEAIELYRGLAADKPETYVPLLATSYGSKGAVLRSCGDELAAIVAFREGVAALKPQFMASPKILRSLMTNLAIDYSKACANTKMKADWTLLGGIIPQLSEE